MATLYVVGLPIGNSEDITLRALRVLQELTVVYCEDTRQAAHLFSTLSKKYQVVISPKLNSYYREKEFAKITEIVSLLSSGTNVGLVSDAGMPTISDPGALLIHATQKAQHTVEVIPGVSAITMAFAYAGIGAKNIVHLGFLPKKRKEIINTFHTIVTSSINKPIAIVFFETARNIRESVKILAEQYPDFSICLCRNMTKQDEKITRGNLPAINILELDESGEYTGVFTIQR